MFKKCAFMTVGGGEGWWAGVEMRARREGMSKKGTFTMVGGLGGWKGWEEWGGREEWDGRKAWWG